MRNLAFTIILTIMSVMGTFFHQKCSVFKSKLEIESRNQRLIVHGVDKSSKGQLIMPIGWKLCERRIESLLTLRRAEINPDPPRKGHQILVSIEGLLGEDIHGGTLTLTVHYNTVPILWKTLDLCVTLKNDGWLPAGCPIPAGHLRINHTIEIPWPVPSGSYSISANALTLEKRSILCVEGSFQLLPSQ